MLQPSDQFLGVDHVLTHGSIQLCSGSPPWQQTDGGGRGLIDTVEIASVGLYHMSHDMI